ncbi:hypothetical protein Rleg9DRAFT_5994 [Rhizobium leguminosarum bv. trifolii WSM597]|uniref:Uncharacterized protein n=1 Tax=Rhizobium leguminosarum bv. trifolii WSM597 TaxID=754764 RepID=J0H9F2_RHILT|nr:hypothetical protein Rleg9DRAFT_5994 [Rhizobium leguminosarum bv. trifolii WSM597]
MLTASLSLLGYLMFSLRTQPSALPQTRYMTYAKFGCVPKDPSEREWNQYLGLSTCR